ncbi:MAG TPA: glycoside hydrolase family 97 N-terminal domain-containing protein, partial [Chryseosolibacter sp.]
MKLLFALLLLFRVLIISAQDHITSPDNSIQVSVTSGESLLISAQYKGTTILKPSEIGLHIRNVKPNWNIRKTSIRKIDENIFPPVAEKRKIIRDHYHELNIEFKSKISLQIRVYNDGFAYRFSSAIKDSIIVNKETALYSFPDETTFYGAAVKKRDDADIYHTSFEEPYLIKPLASVSSDLLFFSPVMIAHSNNIKTVITESDLEDYPGMFLKFNESKHLEGVNAPYPIA